MKAYDIYHPREEIIKVLDELEHNAFESKMRSARRRNSEGEAQWQFYRDAILDVAKELKIDWHPKYN